MRHLLDCNACSCLYGHQQNLQTCGENASRYRPVSEQTNQKEWPWLNPLGIIKPTLCHKSQIENCCKKYAEDIFGKNNYTTILGIRIDEPKRLRPRDGFSYLAEISDFEKQDVLDWWAKMPFDLQIPEHLGNCVFCIKKGINKVALAAKDEPQLADKFIKMINMDDVRIVPSRTTSNDAMYRQSMSLESIIDLYDEMPRDKLAKTVRSTFETGSCSESCEAFAEQMDLAL